MISSTVTDQRRHLSPIPAALAVTPAITARPFNILDPSDIDLPPFPLPPPALTKTVSRETKSFEHKRSVDTQFMINQPPLLCEKKNDEPSTSANLPDLKIASDISSESFSCFIQSNLQTYILPLLLVIF